MAGRCALPCQAVSPPGTLTLAWIHPHNVSHLWAKAIRNIRIWDLSSAHHTAHEYGEFHILCSEGAPSDSRAQARTDLIRRWLPETDAEWLLWFDTDMSADVRLIDQLLAVADPVERPIVGALCFGLLEAGQSSFGGYRAVAVPTIYDLKDDGWFNPRTNYEREALIECDATGSACILIHRSVFKKIKEQYGEIWYRQAPFGDRVLGEDISFCLRAKQCGFPIHVDTRIKTTHDKGVWFLDEDFFDAQDHRVPFAPPATQRVDVVVPVLHRPQNVGRLMDSLRATTGMATAWFIVEDGDFEEMEAVQAAGAQLLFHSGTFAQKVNSWYQTVTRNVAPWVLLVGDDAVFRSGWLDHALAQAKLSGAKVVGTNDLANARVTRGEHATHMLIARDYIDEIGASWDGPGVVCHEGYHHWFVDDEIVTAAKQRGVWAPCLTSIVEHMHPIAGKAPDDEVYQKGRECADADRRRFYRRSLAYAP